MSNSLIIDRDSDAPEGKGRVRGGGGNRPLERVTVNLAARASRALRRVSELTGDSRTDCINRAIEVYGYLQEVIDQGGSIYVRESEKSEIQRLKIF
jgi:hypothetical protein